MNPAKHQEKFGTCHSDESSNGDPGIVSDWKALGSPDTTELKKILNSKKRPQRANLSV